MKKELLLELGDNYEKLGTYYKLLRKFKIFASSFVQADGQTLAPGRSGPQDGNIRLCPHRSSPRDG